MMPRLGADGAPPALPIASLLVGALALTLGAAWLMLHPRLLLGPVQVPSVIALTHVFTLGFVGLVFAGTLQQLPAVMFVTKLVWPKLGYLTMAALLLGAVAVVVGFSLGFAPAWLIPGAIATSLGWLLLTVQLVVTALQRWPKDAGSHALILSVVLLTLTVVLGYLLAGVRESPSLASAVNYVRVREFHLTTGMFGAFMLGIIGSGQKLLSMFALSKGAQQWRIRTALYLVGLGIILAGVAGLFGVDFGPAAVILLAAGAALQLLEVYAIYQKRLRKKLEAPIRRYVLAHFFLPVAGVLMLFGQPVAAAAAFLVGFIGVAVSGMLVKITSFLTWTAVFTGSGVGGVSGGAPLLRDLMRDELEPVTTWTLIGAGLTLPLTFMTGWAPLAYATAALLLVGSVSQLLQVSHVVYTTVAAGRRLASQPAPAKPAAKPTARPPVPPATTPPAASPAPTAGATAPKPPEAPASDTTGKEQ